MSRGSEHWGCCCVAPGMRQSAALPCPCLACGMNTPTNSGLTMWQIADSAVHTAGGGEPRGAEKPGAALCVVFMRVARSAFLPRPQAAAHCSGGAASKPASTPAQQCTNFVSARARRPLSADARCSKLGARPALHSRHRLPTCEEVVAPQVGLDGGHNHDGQLA